MVESAVEQVNGEKPSPPRLSASFRLRSPSLNLLRLRRIFDLFDANHDGLITADELYKALSSLGLEADLPDLESTVESFIKPGNSGLLFDDFDALHKSLDEAFYRGEDEKISAEDENISAAAESELAEAFKVFDENGDGYISAQELQTVLNKLGLPEGGAIEDVEKMIGSVDGDHDGRVDFFEFKNMMRCIA